MYNRTVRTHNKSNDACCTQGNYAIFNSPTKKAVKIELLR